jgi:hypothetical protein
MDISSILLNKWSRYKKDLEYEDIIHSKKSLSNNVKLNILEELSSFNFLRKDLLKLVNKYDYFNTIKYKNISIKYIPIRDLTIKKMKTVIYRLGYISKLLNITKDINIWFIPCKCKRLFPSNRENIEQKHINGGYTYLNSNNIYVYRFEEYAKVFIHELLHHSVLQLKFSNKQLNTLYKEFKIDKNANLEPTEAIIEVWAILLHLKCVSIENNVSFNKLYKLEVAWNINLSNKIKEIHNTIELWKDDTPSYSYVYLKTILLITWKEFIKITVPYNDKIITDYLIKYKDLPIILKNKAIIKKEIAKIPDELNNSLRLTRSGNL